jgi:hypothetical protein
LKQASEKWVFYARSEGDSLAECFSILKRTGNNEETAVGPVKLAGDSNEGAAPIRDGDVNRGSGEEAE